MKKGKNLSGHCKRLVNLLVALLFFFSPHISPVISVARDLTPKQGPLKTGDGPRSGYEELLMAKAMLLSPSVSEMSEALKSLQKEYPRQITLWRELKAQLSKKDPKKNHMEEFLNQAQLIFPSIIAYSVRFSNEQESIEKALANGKSFPKDVKVYHYIRLVQLLHVREKLAFYEAGSQGILTKLFQIISERWNNPASETFKKVNAFEKLRKGQMAKYLKARKDFDQTRFLILKLEQPLNLRMRLWMWGNIDVSLSLADELTSLISRRDSSSTPIRDEWAKSISKELEQIARHRAEEIMAMDGVFSQDHRESLWSILYSPPISHEKSGQIRNKGLPQIQMASRLIRSLEAIQPKIKTLVGILTERNRLLHTIPLLKTDLFVYLRNQLVLEENSLARLKDILQVIEKSKKRPDEIIQNKKLSALYEECGFLKEELIDLETLILSELHVLIQSTPLTSDARWPQVQALLGEEDAWRKSWQSYKVDWKAVVKSFEHYQEDILRRYASGLHELNKHMEHLRKTTGSPIDPMGQQFSSFLESIIRKQLEDSQLAIETKRKMMEFGEKDPLYAHLFGVHQNNFWHMYLGQGHIFYSLERLIIQKHKIMENLRGILKHKISQQQRAFLILQIAKDFGLIQDVGRNQGGYTVVIGSGDYSLVLEGLVLSQQPNLYRMPPIKYTSSYWIEMNQLVRNLLSPSMAYAGIGDFFSNLKQNWSISEYGDNLYSQCAKNKWNYIVSGALGAVLAIPTGGSSLIPFGVQLAADSSIATTRSVVKAGNPQEWEKFNRAIDGVESLYNIGKVVEAAYNIYNRPAVDAAIDRAGENIRKIQSEAAQRTQQLARSQRFWETVADDAANTVANNPGWSNEVKQIVMDLSEINTERAVAIPREMTEVAQNVTKNVNEIEKAIETLVKATGGISRVVQYTVETIGSLPDAISGGEGIIEIKRDIVAEEQRLRHEEKCKQFDAALMTASEAKDINRFRALLEQARAENCDCYQNAYNRLRNWEQQERCKEIEAALDAASQAKDINRFRALVEKARVGNCDFCQNAFNYLQKWERCERIKSALDAASQAKDINRFRPLVEQARAENCDFYQNAHNYLQKWERCAQISSALAAASQAKNINRFRALVEQARVENCDCYQNAYNHLRNWEQQLQHSLIQPQPQPPQPQPPRPQPQPSPPPAERRSIVGEWVGLWHRNNGHIRIVQQGNYYIGYVTQFPPDLSRVLRVGEEIFKVRQTGKDDYNGEMLKIYTGRGNAFIIDKTKRLKCYIRAISQNEIRVTVDGVAFAPSYHLKLKGR